MLILLVVLVGLYSIVAVGSYKMSLDICDSGLLTNLVKFFLVFMSILWLPTTMYTFIKAALK